MPIFKENIKSPLKKIIFFPGDCMILLMKQTKTWSCECLCYQRRTLQEWQNAAQRTYHPLSRCQVVLTKRPFKDLSLIELCHNLTFWVLSQFDFLSYHNLNFWVCHNMTFWFCHNMSFWVLPQLEFLSFVTISVVDFCHNLTFWFNSLQLFHYQVFI